MRNFAIKCITQIHTPPPHTHAHTHTHVFPPIHHWGPPTFPPRTSLTYLPTHLPTSLNQLLHHPPLVTAPKMWQDFLREEGLGSRNGGSKNEGNHTPDASDQSDGKCSQGSYTTQVWEDTYMISLTAIISGHSFGATNRHTSRRWSWRPSQRWHQH